MEGADKLLTPQVTKPKT